MNKLGLEFLIKPKERLRGDKNSAQKALSNYTILINVI